MQNKIKIVMTYEVDDYDEKRKGKISFTGINQKATDSQLLDFGQAIASLATYGSSVKYIKLFKVEETELERESQ